MTYEQYWYGDPLAVRAFFKADQIRRERMDTDAWLQGLYMKEAIESSIGNAFRAQGTRPKQYPAKPYTMAEREEKKATEEQQAAFARMYMLQMMEAGKNWGKP